MESSLLSLSVGGFFYQIGNFRLPNSIPTNTNRPPLSLSLSLSLSSKIVPRCSNHSSTETTTNTKTNTKLALSMLSFAHNNQLNESQAIWDQILNSNYNPPDLQIIGDLIDTYSNLGRSDLVRIILHQLTLRGSKLLPHIFRLALSCLGRRGQLQMMENVIADMGFPLDFYTGNAVLVYYSLHGSLTETEYAYARLKKSRILINKDGIRAMSLAYIKRNKFYSMGEFLREEVGVGRRDVGNLIWNLLLLSYAANFKMKTLQKVFLHMLEAGFHPDITTFNIRAIAFSKMSLFSDLHLTLQHINYTHVVPDLVTYGCVVDAYLDRRLGKNMGFALSVMNAHNNNNNSPQVSTDLIVFEVLGKGGFHTSSEAFLEYKSVKDWTYKDLVSTYVKKKYRSNQIFWNY